MSSSARKPMSNSTNSSGRRTAENTPSKTSIVPASSGQGLAGSLSIRQSRPARKVGRPNNTNSADVSGEEEDTRASSAQLIAELKEQVRKAELASEQYQKQVELLQARLDEISNEQTAAEEREQHSIAKIEALQSQLKDATRQRRETEQDYGAEKESMLHDRERRISKEEELQAVIQRLNETIRQKSKERLSMSRSANLQNTLKIMEEPVSPSGISSTENAETILQRDQTIDMLRLELVDAQIKLAEMDHLGDGRVQELEKALMETKMANARLTEDNESFQYLLSEKTLKGNFLHDSRPSESFDQPTGLSSLAEELESVGDGSEGQSDGYKRLEAENKALKDGNKALTLYVDKIIGRILQHEGFEHIITGRDEPPAPPTKPMPVEKADKALPATPDQAAGSAAPASFLQRARSVVQRPAATKARPQSIIAAPTANENPDTAPSIPLTRGHRRARSDQAQTDMGAAAVVQQMNRGSPLRTASGGHMSPGISPQLQPTRMSYFQPIPPSSGRIPPSGVPPTGKGSSANSVTSDHSGEKDTATDASSAQASSHGASNLPGAVMKQNQLRPLRLLQGQQLSNEENEAQKRANRGSWMGWFKGPESQVDS